MAKTLHLKSSGKLLLRMNDAQFEDLTRLLQEEDSSDRDYFVDETTIPYLLAKGCDHALVEVLRHALTHKRTAYRDPATPEVTQDENDAPDGIDIEWRDSEESA